MAIPKKDSLLVPFSTNFNTRIVAAPGDFSLTAGQAASYTAVHTPFITAYQAMVDARAAGNRSQSLTEAKTTAKHALLAYARGLYAFIQNSTSVTDANKVLLGIKLKNNSPTPVPAPSVAPGTEVVSVIGRTVRVRIHDSASSTKRGKPAGVKGANLYSFVGTTYPSDPSQWRYEGSTTKDLFDVSFPDSVAAGSQVWIIAVWFNPTAETGPSSAPITTNVQYGLSMAA